MGAAKGILSFAAGFGKGYMDKDDQLYERGRREKQDQREEEAHAARMDEVAEKKRERTVLSDAAKPLAVEVPNDVLKDDEGNDMPAVPAFRVGGQRFEDASAAGAAAEAGNTPEAADARMAQAYRGLGKPMEARQLEAAGQQAKAAKFTLDREQQKWADEQYDKQLTQITQVSDAAAVLTDLTGSPVTTVASPDGKTVQFMRQGPDGQQVKMGQEFENTPEGLQKFLITKSKSLSTAEKIGALRSMSEFDERRKQWGKEFEQRESHFQENKRLQKQQLAISQGHLSVAQAGEQRAKEKHADEQKIKPADKLAIAGIDGELNTLSKSINDAMAKNEWDPNTANAKELLARQTFLGRQRRAVLAKYDQDAGAAAPGGNPAPGAAAGGPRTVDGAQLSGVKSMSAQRGPDGNWQASPPSTAGWDPQSVGALPAGGAAPEQPAARGVPQAAQPPQQAQQDPLLVALGASGSSGADQVVAKKAPVLRQAAEDLKAAQGQVAMAAKGQNPQATQQAMQQSQAAIDKINAILKDMNPAQAQAVRQALGV